MKDEELTLKKFMSKCVLKRRAVIEGEETSGGDGGDGGDGGEG